MMKMINRYFIFMCFLTFANNTTFAQRPENFWRNPEGMIQEQAILLFEQAHKILANNPPSAVANDERKLALISIDALLHDNRIDNSKAFIDYVEKRIQTVVDKIKNETLNENEIRIHKLYNHAFIVQTPTVTIGFDIYRGGRSAQPFISEALTLSVVNLCDILFVSHEHRDHADMYVAQLFCEQQKNVIAPAGLWENMSPQIIHLRGENVVTERINISHKNATLTVKVFPGHQDVMLNNVYAVTTPEGKTFMHTGDQYNTDDVTKWITSVNNEVKVDVLLVHCWMLDMEKSIDGIKPEIIIVGHENEMGHTIDHREPFWLTFRRMQNIRVPYVVMAWGESYNYFY